MAKKPRYGGQAVIEGVMFRGRKAIVTAIRRKDGSIDYFHEEIKEYPWVNKIIKIPFLRGMLGLLAASAIGSKHLNFSSERYDVAPGEEEPTSAKDFSTILSITIMGVLSFIFGKLVFTIVPAILADVLFTKWVTHQILQNLIEGGIKVILLLAYLFALSQTPLIKRIFQYHGAEHKVINAYEAGKELSIVNVQKASTLHYRCGSSFIVFTILIGVIIYSMFPYESLWERITQRILLLPVVIGVSYEALQLSNHFSDTPLLRGLGLPGLWLQKLTTKEPDDSQVEVAIASFKKMQELELKMKQMTKTG